MSRAPKARNSASRLWMSESRRLPRARIVAAVLATRDERAALAPEEAVLFSVMSLR